MKRSSDTPGPFILIVCHSNPGNFKTTIDGLDIHFVHSKPTPEASKGKTVVPLLIVHGWPGSFFEFEKIMPILTRPQTGKDFIFEVVAPSIPGTGKNCYMHIQLNDHNLLIC